MENTKIYAINRTVGIHAAESNKTITLYYYLVSTYDYKVLIFRVRVRVRVNFPYLQPYTPSPYGLASCGVLPYKI